MKEIPVDELKIGMKMGDDLIIHNRKILPAGAVLTARYIRLLKEIGLSGVFIDTPQDKPEPEVSIISIEPEGVSVEELVLKRFAYCNKDKTFVKELIRIVTEIELEKSVES